MNQIVKNLITLSISSVFSINLISTVSAATYEVIDKGEASNLKFTYAQQQNLNGAMAISGTDIYNFPVQFDYLSDEDFEAIRLYAFQSHFSVHALTFIEEFDDLKAGNPTANDLAWVVRWLQRIKGTDIEYQKVGDTVAMTNLGVGELSQEFTLWDVPFAGTTELTRSTVDIVSGFTDSGIAYGTATAPYLPLDPFFDSEGIEHTYWLREYGNRGFFSYDQGAQIHQVIPFETEYGGGLSAVLDINETGFAVGFSSYKLTQSYKDVIENTDGGCGDPDIVPGLMPFDACIARAQLQAPVDIYHSMALKASIDSTGAIAIEALGLLVMPHPDDERVYSSRALAVNSEGVAVGYADGFNDETVTDPSEEQLSIYHYAVVFKNDEVIDLSGEHNNQTGSSRAFDINDAGIAVGHITKAINGKAVQKFFYVDTSVIKEEITMITPDDFFTGSKSTVRAVNNDGFMVGEGEIETHDVSFSNGVATNPRRTAAFIYDMNNDVFTNLNRLIACASPYNILEARGINDAGYISATAIVKMNRRDAKGELMFDDNGTQLTEDVVRAVTLKPIPDDGAVCTPEEDGKVIRKGAGIGFGFIFTLIMLLGFRKKLFF